MFLWLELSHFGMERRRASPEQLHRLLQLLEEDKLLAIGKFAGLQERLRQANAWIKITEKLNAKSELDSGAIKTPNKWQQTWRDWKSNVRKKAFKIKKNLIKTGSTANNQLTKAEQRILRLISTNPSAFGIAGVPETSAILNDAMASSQSNNQEDDLCNSDNSTSNMKWLPDTHNTQPDVNELIFEVKLESDDNFTNIDSNEVSPEPVFEKPCPTQNRPTRLVNHRLLNFEEEKIRIEKQKLFEKKRCNNIRLKIEKDRLEIEKQRNVLLEKLLMAVQSAIQR